MDEDRDKNKLVGDQWLQPEEVRQIVLEEQMNFIEVLKLEVVNTPRRADQNMNQSDFARTLDIVQTKLKSRIVL